MTLPLMARRGRRRDGRSVRRVPEPAGLKGKLDEDLLSSHTGIFGLYGFSIWRGYTHGVMIQIPSYRRTPCAIRRRSVSLPVPALIDASSLAVGGKVIRARPCIFPL